MNLPIVGFEPDDIDPSGRTRAARLKWVVVVDEGVAAGRQVNAVACIAAATGARVDGLLGADGLDAEGGAHAGLPWAGCIILVADADRLVTIRAAAASEPDVLLIGMAAVAQESRVYDEYLAALAATPPAGIREIALGLIGPRKSVDRLVRRLPLLR